MTRCTWTVDRNPVDRTPIACDEPASYEYRTVKLCEDHREAAVYGGFPWPLTKIREKENR